MKEESDSAFCMLLGNRLKNAEPEYLKVIFARLRFDFGQVQISFSASIVTMYIVISSEIV